MAPYHEHQRFALWVYALVVAILCVSLGTMLFLPDDGRGGPVPREVVYIYAGLFALLFNLLSLRTKVEQDAVHVCLGWPIPLFWKRIRLDTLVAARVVTYRPIRDAGGWGLRFGRIEGTFTIFWNARGNQGVLIDTATRRYVLGTQFPKDLHAAIEKAIQQQNR